MAQRGQRKCLCCHDLFFPEARSAGRQRYCSAAACRRASKAASQAAWLAKPENVDYFAGPMNVERVQAWRAAHPGHARGRRRGRCALQDSLPLEVTDLVEQIGDRAAPAQSPGALALQDLLTPSAAVLAGLIAHLFEVSLQDDMAATTRRLVQRGQDLILGVGDGCELDGQHKARAAPRAAAAGAGAVQLG